MRARIVLSYLACSCIWGTTFFAIRVSIAPGGYPTYLAAALRFVIAAIVVVGVVVAGGIGPRPRSRSQAGWIFLAGVVNFGSYALIYTAEQSITGGLACVIFGTLPLVTAILAAVSGTEKPSAAAVGGALISLAGIGIIFRGQLAISPKQATSVGVAILGVCLSGTFNTILKRKAGGVHPFAQSAWFMTATAAAMTVAALAAGRPMPWPPPPGPTLAVLYLAIIGSVVAFGFYFYLLQHTRLMVASTVVLVQPLIALLVDTIWETQRLDASSYVGAAVTLLGVAVNLLLTARST